MNATDPAANPPQPGPNAVERLLVGLLAVLFLITPYLTDGDDGSAGNELVGDGLALVTRHEVLTGIAAGEASLADCLTTTWWGNVDPNQTLYRPLSTLALGVAAGLAGTYDEAQPGDAPVPYHLIAIALKAICALLVLELAWVLLRNRKMALCAGALFATLPVHGEVLFDVAGVAELLCAALSLGAWIAWVRAGDEEEGRLANLSAAVGLTFLATLAKESAFALPLVFLLTDVGRAKEGGLGAGVRHALGRLPALGLVALALGASLGLRITVAGGLFPEVVAINELDNPLYAEGGFTRGANAMRLVAAGTLSMVGVNLLSSGTFEPGLWNVRTGVGPFPYSADYSISQVEVLSPFAPMNLLGLLFVVGTIGLAVILYQRCRVRAALWLTVFGAMAVTSNVLFAVGTVYAERLLFFPSAALVLFLAAFLGRRGTIGVGIALVMAVGGGVWTYARASDWSDNGQLWQHTAQRTSKDSARAHYNYALDLLRDNITPLAEKELRLALGLYPEYADAHAQLGVVLVADIRLDEADLSFRDAVRIRLASQEYQELPVEQEPTFGVNPVLDMATIARCEQSDVDNLKAHVAWLESLEADGYESAFVPQKIGECYRVLFEISKNADAKLQFRDLAVESFERSLAMEQTAVATRSYAAFLEESLGDDESLARARGLYASLPMPEHPAERARIVIAQCWHKIDAYPDEVLRTVEEILQENRDTGFLDDQLGFEAKLLQALAKIELIDLDPTNATERLREVRDHLRTAIALQPHLTSRTHFAVVSLVETLVRMGEFGDAQTVLEGVLLQDPAELGAQPGLRTRLARIYESQQRFEDARDAYEQAAVDLLAEEGDYLDREAVLEAREGLLRVERYLGNLDGVLAHLDAWHLGAPGEHDELTLYLEAMHRASRGDFVGAVERLDVHAVAFPTESEIPGISIRKQQLEEVVALLAKFDPTASPMDDLNALLQRRLQYLDAQGAVDTAQVALARDLPVEDRALVLDRLAAARELLLDFQGALDAVREALALEGVSPEGQANLKARQSALEQLLAQ